MDIIAKHAKLLQKLREKGTAVEFLFDVDADDYNPLTDTGGEPTAGSLTGRAVEIPSDPIELEPFGLSIVDTATLFFVPDTINTAPPHNATVMWAGAKRTVKNYLPIRPTGTIIGVKVFLV